MEYILRCDVCQWHKYQAMSPTDLLQSIPILEVVWTDISMDFITGLPLLQPKQLQKVSSEMWPNCTCFPILLLIENPLFLSKFWGKLFRLQGTVLRMSTTYNP